MKTPPRSLGKQGLERVEKHRATRWSWHGGRSRAGSTETGGKGPKKRCGGRGTGALLAPRRIRPLSRKRICK